MFWDRLYVRKDRKLTAIENGKGTSGRHPLKVSILIVLCCVFLLGQETWPPLETPEIAVTQPSADPTTIVELEVTNGVAFFAPYVQGGTAMTATVGGQTIDLDVSLMPTMHGCFLYRGLPIRKQRRWML